MKRLSPLAATVLAAALLVVGCGGSSGGSSHSKTVDPNAKETSPPGDIPDNQAFVAYAPPGAGFTVKVPEGWARTTQAGDVTFTDKLNSVTISRAAPGKAPAGSHTSTVARSAGRAVRTTYIASGAPDPVTGKTRRNAVERYSFTRSGKHAVLTLSGPKGADNVDPWKIITDSLRWKR